MQTTGVHHVSLNVTNAVESIEFYTDILGFELRDDRPEFDFAGAWLQAGDQQVHVLEVADFRPPKGQHFALAVDDLDGAVAELAERSVEVSPISTVGDICRQAFFYDPTGNLIELNQRLS